MAKWIRSGLYALALALVFVISYNCYVWSHNFVEENIEIPAVNDSSLVSQLLGKLDRLQSDLRSSNEQRAMLEDQVRVLRTRAEEVGKTRQVISVNNTNKKDDFNASMRAVSDILKWIPNLFSLMPHLENDIQGLLPANTSGKVNHGVEVVIAVPHVHRQVEDYLVNTITSLFGSMSADQKKITSIVVMVGEPWNTDIFGVVLAELLPKFNRELEAGHLQIILPPAKWYPNLENLPQKWGDKPDRAKWRTKQNLDYAFLMLYGSRLGKYYVQLEDDVTAKQNFVSLMLDFASSSDRWELLEFSQLGFIGKMFKKVTLLKFVNFLLMFYQHKPVDWLLENYFWVQECYENSCSDLATIKKRYKPSLFQHEGLHSSLSGKVQKLKDRDFGQPSDPVVYQHENPSAKLETTLKQYQKFSLEQLYQGKSVFWALNPQPNDHITITFSKAEAIKRYRVVTGDTQHRDDRLKNASLEVLPAGPANIPSTYIRLDHSDYIMLQFFNTTASRVDDSTVYTIAEGRIPPEFGNISAVRIQSHSESQNWVIFNEIWFEL